MDNNEKREPILHQGMKSGVMEDKPITRCFYGETMRERLNGGATDWCEHEGECEWEILDNNEGATLQDFAEGLPRLVKLEREGKIKIEFKRCLITLRQKGEAQLRITIYDPSK